MRGWEEWPGLALRLGTGEQIAKAIVEWETGWAERARRDPVHSGSQGKFLDWVDTLLQLAEPIGSVPVSRRV